MKDYSRNIFLYFDLLQWKHHLFFLFNSTAQNITCIYSSTHQQISSRDCGFSDIITVTYCLCIVFSDTHPNTTKILPQPSLNPHQTLPQQSPSHQHASKTASWNHGSPPPSHSGPCWPPAGGSAAGWSSAWSTPWAARTWCPRAPQCRPQAPTPRAGSSPSAAARQSFRYRVLPCSWRPARPVKGGAISRGVRMGVVMSRGGVISHRLIIRRKRVNK